MKLLALLGRFLTFWTSISVKYNLLKNDEEKRATSKKFGKNAIVMSILSTIIVGLCVWGFIALWNHFVYIGENLTEVVGDGQSEFPFFSLLGLISLGGTIVITFFRVSFGALFHVIYQKKLNSLAIGNTALVIWFLCLIAQIVLISLIFIL